MFSTNKSRSLTRFALSRASSFGVLDNVGNLKNVGFFSDKRLKSFGILRIIDVLLKLPSKWIPLVSSLKDATSGDSVKLEVLVKSVQFPFSLKSPLVVIASSCGQESTNVNLVFWSRAKTMAKVVHTQMLANLGFVIGQKLWISGRLHQKVAKKETYELHNPKPLQPGDMGLKFENTYNTEGMNVSLKIYSSLVEQCLECAHTIDDWLDPSTLEALSLPSIGQAVYRLHRPATSDDTIITSPFARRLAFDEILASQMIISLLSHGDGIFKPMDGKQESHDFSIPSSKDLVDKLIKSLPFPLTNCQERASREIAEDLERPTRMNRLLQGDVGSGKTLACIISALHAVEAGRQVVVMVPTSILANQMYQAFSSMTNKIDSTIKIGLLTSSTSAPIRRRLVADLAIGDMKIVIGTHALLSEDVQFHNVGLIVIDEEHKFGVQQRDALCRRSNVLFMSATPIPRSLAHTIYGDIEISKLLSKPPGTIPVVTSLYPTSKTDDIMNRVLQEANNGRKIIWIVPRIGVFDDDEEKIDFDAELEEISDSGVDQAKETVAQMTVAERLKVFQSLPMAKNVNVGVLHGRLPPDERDCILKDFKEKQSGILICTSIIEVGLDINDISIAVIENCSRFGVSQLHQMRGRVGRPSCPTDREYHCVLLYYSDGGDEVNRFLPSNKAKRNEETQAIFDKLHVLTTTSDGFQIAEADLKQRGPGTIVGNRQSGPAELSHFRIADPLVHSDLIEPAVQIVRNMRSGKRSLALTKPLIHLPRIFFPGVIADLFGEKSDDFDVWKQNDLRLLQFFGKAKLAESIEESVVSGHDDKGVLEMIKSDVDKYIWSECVPKVAETQVIETDSGSIKIEKFADISNSISIAEHVVSTGGKSKPPTAPAIMTAPIDIKNCVESSAFFILDIESTGSTSSDRIIQLAALPYNREARTTSFYNSYIFPENVKVPKMIEKLTGIDNVFLKEHGVSFSDAWKKFVDFVCQTSQGRDVALAAHSGKSFDFRILVHELIRHSLIANEHQSPLNILEGKVPRVRFVDTLTMFNSQTLWKLVAAQDVSKIITEPKSKGLSALHHHFCEGQSVDGQHNALADVLALESILRHNALKDVWPTVAQDKQVGLYLNHIDVQTAKIEFH